ncbi:phenylacetate--CoA ligase family protein [bacterium]|nr:phenylacetate--CoA ligase family protein [bacterium]
MRSFKDHATSLLEWSKLSRYRRQLTRENELSISASNNLQTRLWLKMAHRAVLQVPYYRQHFQEQGYSVEMITGLDSLALFPLITRDIVKEHTAAFIADDYRSKRLWKGHTSGSTGPALDLFMPRFQTTIEKGYIYSQWRRFGYEPGKSRLLAIRARPDYISQAGSIVEKLPKQPVYNASVFQVNERTLPQLLEVIAAKRIEFIHTYPSTASYLAGMMESFPGYLTQFRALKAFLLSSETLHPGAREMVNRVFGVQVCAHYGHAEHLILGGNCEHNDEYHLWPSYGLVQLVDNAGNEISAPGLAGELVGTTLTNPAMPLIRYRSGDFAEWSQGDCACGRKWRRICNVIGKYSTDVLFDDSGDRFNLSLIMRVIIFLRDVYPFEFLHRYQFVQETAGEVRLKIMPMQTFTTEMAEQIREGFEHYTEGRIRIQLETVTDIPLEKSGKVKLLVQKLTQEQDEQH